MIEANFLKERAGSFFRNGKDLIKKKEYPLAAFNFEQAAQLYLKYYISLKLGDYPKTHSLRILLQELGKAYNKSSEIEKIIKREANLIADLEQAYLTSRYLPAEFFEYQVENMQKFVTGLIKFLKNL